MRLSYDLRLEIRLAVDLRARRRLHRLDLIERELRNLRDHDRAVQRMARARREVEWRASLPAMLSEWSAAQR